MLLQPAEEPEEKSRPVRTDGAIWLSLRERGSLRRLLLGRMRSIVRFGDDWPDLARLVRRDVTIALLDGRGATPKTWPADRPGLSGRRQWLTLRRLEVARSVPGARDWRRANYML